MFILNLYLYLGAAGKLRLDLNLDLDPELYFNRGHGVNLDFGLALGRDR